LATLQPQVVTESACMKPTQRCGAERSLGRLVIAERLDVLAESDELSLFDLFCVLAGELRELEAKRGVQIGRELVAGGLLDVTT
jgi:hypothetical protein